ncbi:hypothetical protein KC571_00605 [candidate division WWE3 bacterium]|uniref:CBU-0592-like domain-containing protein n=1 Tax=candidate division WWE3 bacterium TaxID=2053526 RepID=A0A955LGN7_UNCKA|nr:hypothetical protein [candidate division WWE3 bacterium]
MQSPQSSKILEIFGWYGTVAIIGAYFLNSFQIIAATDLSYQLLNLTGGFGIIAISWHKKVFQSVALNIIWSFIAIIAIVRIFI